MVVLVEFAQAQKHLPKGFKARDAQGLLGLPASSGRGAVALNAVNCGQSELTAQDVSEGKLVVYVDPPNVAGERPPAEPNFYEVARYTPNEEMLRLLRAVGWRALEGSVAIAIQTQASGAATGNGEVRDDEGIVVHTFGMTAPAPAPLAGLARFWHDTPGGVAYFDYKADTNVAQGSGSCSIKSGSVGHNLTGIQTCPNGQTFSLVFPSYKWEGRFEYLAGTHAA